MKKILLSAAFSGLAIAAVNAQQHFYDDFSSGNMNNWTLTDDDGDGFDWSVVDYDDGVQEEHASSSSWDNGTILNPDNWMVNTTAIDLSGVTGTTELRWKVYGQDQAYADENYSVYVATASDIATLGASGTNFTEVVGTSTGYMERSLDVSALNGSMIYVAFRHHNVSDMFRLNIDDIEVVTLLADDIQMVSHSVSAVVQAGNLNITGTIKNNGANTVNSFELSYDAGAGVVSETVNQTIAPGATYDFTHSTPLNATVAGSPYSIDVCATNGDDLNNSNDCVTANVSVVSSIVDKYVVLEEKTGTWCQYCPSGAAAMDAVTIGESKAIGIAIHNSDPMAVASYDSGSANFPDFGGYPYAAADRAVGAHAASMQTSFDARENVVASGSVAVTATENGNNIDVEATVTAVANLSGDYRIAVVLVEDDVTGTGNDWLQVNAFSGSTSVPHTTPDGQTFNWQNLDANVDVSTVFGGYDHVARALADNQINGAAGSLPATMTDGSDYSHTYSIAKDAAWDLTKMKAVAMFVDNATGEVINAGKSGYVTVGLNENELSNFETSVYPNPTNGLANVVISLEEAANVSMQVVDLNGKVVFNKGAENLSAGQFMYNVDLSEVPNGFYFAKVVVNNVVKTIKISVSK